MKKYNTSKLTIITALILTASLFLSGCSESDVEMVGGGETGSETVTENTVAEEAVTTPAATVSVETTEPVTSATETETTAITTAAETEPTTEAPATASVTSSAPSAWTETAASGTMYINTNGIYSRKEAVQGSTKVKQYSLNEAVIVTAKTDTNYYKLSDGSFIHADYLSANKVTITTTTTAAPVAPVVTTNATVANDNYKYEQSLKVAEELADFVRETAGSEKSLKQIACAAEAVYYNFYRYCAYSQTEKDDWTAYGVFIAHKASCQGAADALGMVLNILGYKWEHINKNLYTHQWCKVYFNYNQEAETKEGETKTIDGSIVYADASVPMQALIGIGGEYGEDALLFSYYDFVVEDETGVLHESTSGVIF